MFAVTTTAGRVLRISPPRARIEIDPPDIAGRFAADERLHGSLTGVLAIAKAVLDRGNLPLSHF